MDAFEKGIVKSSITDLWTNLGKMIVISLLWGFILLFSIFSLPIAVSLAVFYFLGFPILTGNIYAISKIRRHEKYFYKENIIGLKKFYTKSLLFYGVVFIASFILGASIWQYYKMRTELYLVLLIIQGFFYICFLISQIYTIPLIVEKNISFKEAFVTSFQMTIDDPMYAVSSWFKLLIAMILSAVGFITIPLFSAGIFGVFSLNIYHIKADAKSR